MRSPALRKSLRLASIAADAALERYPQLGVVDRKLLAHTHNTTYRLALRDGDFAVLKIRPPADDDGAELLSEMQWLDALARQTDLLVPQPIRNRAGALVTEVTDHGDHGDDRPHLCRVMSWVPGRKLGRSLRPQHFIQLGELIASLHDHAGRFRPPRGFVRLRWDEEFERRVAGLVRAGRDGRISRRRMKVFGASVRRARRVTRRFGRSREVYRLIHADLGFANHLYHRGRAGAIDFEGCGYGWLLHDLAEPLCFLQHSRHFGTLRDALLEGYRRVRAMPEEMERFLPDFIDFAAMTTLGYTCGEPSRAHDLGWMSKYLSHVLRPA